MFLTSDSECSSTFIYRKNSMLASYHKAFKAYDIRGIYGEHIDERFAYTLWKAIGRYMFETYGNEATLLVASDVRNCNVSLIRYFETGLAKWWIHNVSYAAFEQSPQYPYGICSTTMVYYLTQNSFDLGVSFTASHNPPEFAGMKFFDRDVKLLSTEMLWELFEQAYDPDEEIVLNYREDIVLDPKIAEKQEALFAQLQKKREGLSQAHHFVVDFSSGAAVTNEKKKLKHYVDPKHTIHHLNDTPDSDFTAHPSETQEAENYTQLADKIKEVWAHWGVMFDGDADRIGIVWPDGIVLGGDIVGAMIAKQILLEDNSHLANIILHETMCSKVFHEKIVEWWAKAEMVRVGRYFINQELAQRKWIFAGESSGHFLFGDIGNYEMPLLALYYFMKEVEEHQTREALIHEFTTQAKSPVISMRVADKEGVLDQAKKTYADHQHMFVDGISVYAPDFWFNLRPSNTEDKIKFCVEADTQERMETIVEEIKWIINGINKA